MMKRDDHLMPLVVKLKKPGPWVLLFASVVGVGAVWLSQELATMYRRTARDAKFINEIVLSAEATPDTRDALHAGLQALAEQQQTVAQAIFHHILQDDPQSQAAMLGLAQISYEEGQLAQAQAQVSEVLELNPHSAQAYFLLGLILRKNGQPEPARMAFMQCIKADAVGQFKPIVQQMIQSL